jgi:hypothetical protein
MTTAPKDPNWKLIQLHFSAIATAKEDIRRRKQMIKQILPRLFTTSELAHALETGQANASDIRSGNRNLTVENQQKAIFYLEKKHSA